MQIFKYGQTEINYLKSRDKRFAEAIERIGCVKREVFPNLFAALVNAIVGQQVSMQAQRTVWERVVQTLGKVTPETADSCSNEDLRKCGMSERKVRYIKNAARRVCSGELSLESLAHMNDRQVCDTLIKLDGVGVWTAEMRMLFYMKRADVLSFGDLAIQKGMRMLYRHREITKERFERYRKRYSPYGSVASIYLWEIAGGAIDGLTDPAAVKGARK